MEFVEIAERFATVVLTPEECRDLAAACRAAVENGATPDPIRTQTLGAAFDAAALAAVAYSYAGVDVEDRLTLSAMRAYQLGNRSEQEDADGA